jgi:hypothetical protein
MNRGHRRTCAPVFVVSAALALLGAAESYAQTSYGEDPIPNSQFWNHQLTQGYGVDPVPQSSTNESPYQPVYGVDPVPDARYYKRSLDMMPRNFDQQEQVLTSSRDDERPTNRPSRTRFRARGGSTNRRKR